MRFGNYKLESFSTRIKLEKTGYDVASMKWRAESGVWNDKKRNIEPIKAFGKTKSEAIEDLYDRLLRKMSKHVAGSQK